MPKAKVRKDDDQKIYGMRRVLGEQYYNPGFNVCAPLAAYQILQKNS